MQKIKKSRHPRWEDEFQFFLEEAPLKDHIHIEVMSVRRRARFFRSKVISPTSLTFLNSPFCINAFRQQSTSFAFYTVYTVCMQESLGYVDIHLRDVVYNGRINEEHHLINSKNGLLHVDIRWKVIWSGLSFDHILILQFHLFLDSLFHLIGHVNTSPLKSSKSFFMMLSFFSNHLEVEGSMLCLCVYASNMYICKIMHWFRLRTYWFRLRT